MATVYDFNLKDKKGNEVSLETYKGKVLLIVNTATGCGFTPQYEELEAMYRSLKEKGRRVLRFSIFHVISSVIRLQVQTRRFTSSVQQSLELTSHSSKRVM